MAEEPALTSSMVDVSIQSAIGENGRHPVRRFEKPCTYEHILNILIIENGGQVSRETCSIKEPGFGTIPISYLSQQVSREISRTDRSYGIRHLYIKTLVLKIGYFCCTNLLHLPMQSGPRGATRGQPGSCSRPPANDREYPSSPQTRVSPTRCELSPQLQPFCPGCGSVRSSDDIRSLCLPESIRQTLMSDGSPLICNTSDLLLLPAGEASL